MTEWKQARYGTDGRHDMHWDILRLLTFKADVTTC